MKIKRIDDNTIRCIVTEEDMKEYGLELEDFIMNKDKARDFLESVVKQAVEEVGYEVKNGALAMQLMQLPKNALAITFSENGDSSLHSMLNYVKETAEALKKLGDTDFVKDMEKAFSEGKIDELDDLISNLKDPSEEMSEPSNTNRVKVDKGIKNSKDKVKKNRIISLFKFRTLADVEHFSSIVTIQKIITSILYKDEVRGDYYLTISKGRLSAIEYEKLSKLATEFGDYISENQMQLAYCEEHFSCLIKKKAVNILRDLG
jgi:adapter protein MecA 1/2